MALSGSTWMGTRQSIVTNIIGWIRPVITRQAGLDFFVVTVSISDTYERAEKKMWIEGEHTHAMSNERGNPVLMMRKID